jgi:hypothetical protein
VLAPTEKVGKNDWLLCPIVKLGALWDVRHLAVSAILVELEALQSFMDLAAAGGSENKVDFLERLEALWRYCKDHGLELSEMAIQPLYDALHLSDSAPLGSFANEVKIIRGRIIDELRIPRFFFIPREKARFFEVRDSCRNVIPPFGFEVQKRFGAIAGEDIDEAGKCYAAGRNTACVFHLMRVIEAGLVELKTRLGVVTKSPNWDQVIKDLQNAVDARVGRDPAWREEHRFYSDCLAQLRNIKDGWRNPVMHVVEKHDEVNAFGIYEHTKAFMQRLARNDIAP